MFSGSAWAALPKSPWRKPEPLPPKYEQAAEQYREARHEWDKAEDKYFEGLARTLSTATGRTFYVTHDDYGIKALGISFEDVQGVIGKRPEHVDYCPDHVRIKHPTMKKCGRHPDTGLFDGAYDEDVYVCKYCGNEMPDPE